MNYKFFILYLIILFPFQGYAQSVIIEPPKAIEGEALEELLEEEVADYDEDEYYDEYEQRAPNKSLRTIPENDWQKVKNDPRYQYKKIEIEKKKKKPKKRKKWNLDWLNSGFFELLLYLLVGAFLLFIIYSFFKNNDISFSRKRRESEETEDAPWEDVEHFEDWERALYDALAAKNYRLASRILYLQSMQQLHSRSFIEYKDDKTNWHYVQKLFGTELHDPFRKLTAYFDYIWYGQYEIDESQFEQISEQFSNFKQLLES